jgi:hypothetical protein
MPGAAENTPGISAAVLCPACPDDVLPHLSPGVEFSLWAGKTIGTGTVLRVENTA